MLSYMVRQRVGGEMLAPEYGAQAYPGPVQAVREADRLYADGASCVDVLVVDEDGFSERIYLRRNDSALLNVPNLKVVA